MAGITIYGSCVSRDAFEVDSNQLKLDAYFARSSWISTANKAVTIPNKPSALQSKFQQRMLETDFRSTALWQVNHAGSDVVLLDLVDERVGVVKDISGGGYLTYLGELKRSGWLEELQHSSLIRFGTDLHFKLFEAAAARVAVAFRERRVILLKSDFAECDSEGTAVPPLLAKTSAEWNAQYRRYFDVAETVASEVLEIPKHLCVADPSHRWGVAPYHYVPEFYAFVRENLTKLIVD